MSSRAEVQTSVKAETYKDTQTHKHTMAKQSLSSEYVSDSDTEETGNNEFHVPHYEVPKDYKKVKHLKSVPTLQNSKDHELWLFKVPKGVDISKIKSLPLAKDSTFQIGKENFQVELDELESKDNSNMAILSNSEKHSDVLNIATRNDKTVSFNKIFNINKTTKIPKIKYDKVRVPRENVPTIEGLIVRHHATGYDAEEEETKPKEKSKKRKHEEEEEVTVSEPKKEKKDKKDKKKKEKKDKKKKEKKH